jgi:hypothetical protein
LRHALFAIAKIRFEIKRPVQNDLLGLNLTYLVTPQMA